MRRETIKQLEQCLSNQLQATSASAECCLLRTVKIIKYKFRIKSEFCEWKWLFGKQLSDFHQIIIIITVSLKILEWNALSKIIHANFVSATNPNDKQNEKRRRRIIIIIIVVVRILGGGVGVKWKTLCRNVHVINNNLLLPNKYNFIVALCSFVFRPSLDFDGNGHTLEARRVGCWCFFKLNFINQSVYVCVCVWYFDVQVPFALVPMQV